MRVLTLALQKQYKKALKVFEEIDSMVNLGENRSVFNNYFAYTYKAVVLYLKKDFQSARKNFKKAIEL